MTLDELKSIQVTLQECSVNAEEFDFGPAYGAACLRRQEAIRVIKKAIRDANKENSKHSTTM